MKPVKKQPRLRMFAGPNGSGKSTIKDAIPDYLLGVYLNADDIEKQIGLTGRFDVSVFQASAEAALSFLHQSSFLAEQNLTDQLEGVSIDQQSLNFAQLNMNSYFASVLVDFLRQHLLDQQISFTFETVMSHRSKVDFLKAARAHGFRTYLYFVATADPEINISRVAYRVSQGGHAVEPQKIIDRYGRSLDLLIDAISASHRAYIFDNSLDLDTDSTLLAEVTDGTELELKVDAVPMWFKTAVLDRF